MSELMNTRKPETIANEIVRLSYRMLEDAIEVGRRFVELKAAVPHGEWGKWLEYTGYKSSSANNMMRLFEAYGNDELSLFGNVKSQTFGNLGYSKALELLAVPEDQREEFAVAVDAEHLSVRQLKAKIQEHQEAERAANNRADGWRLKAEQAKADADLARESVTKLSDENSLLQNQVVNYADSERILNQRIKELESRPVDVAIQTIDATPEQLEKARKEGERDANTAAAGKMEVAEKQWKEVVEQQKAEIQALTTELEELRRDASEEGVKQTGEINSTFHGLIGSVNRLLSMVNGVDEVTSKRITAKLVQFFRSTADRLERGEKK